MSAHTPRREREARWPDADGARAYQREALDGQGRVEPARTGKGWRIVGRDGRALSERERANDIVPDGLRRVGTRPAGPDPDEDALWEDEMEAFRFRHLWLAGAGDTDAVVGGERPRWTLIDRDGRPMSAGEREHIERGGAPPERFTPSALPEFRRVGTS